MLTVGKIYSLKIHSPNDNLDYPYIGRLLYTYIRLDRICLHFKTIDNNTGSPDEQWENNITINVNRNDPTNPRHNEYSILACTEYSHKYPRIGDCVIVPTRDEFAYIYVSGFSKFNDREVILETDNIYEELIFAPNCAQIIKNIL